MQTIKIMAIALIVIMLIVGIVLALREAVPVNFTVVGIIMFIVALYIVFTIHELIHGLLFWVLGNGKIKISLKKGLLYFNCPNQLFAKWQYNIISIGPCVLLTLILVILALEFPGDLVAIYLLIVAHSALCMADMYTMKIIASAPKKAKIRDTKDGIIVVSEK
ncbi:DUF3267 domain-containing protein [Listeria cornellensis]|uniref:DUF3267 domain-containing protein n=1 Tax=Listeria cornellensis FSL F6-0969 TaxID=1265820 RepID=W7BFH2_9LIST|nr:DUF3267 domain-containing protein [Listeria cornellensis]EUJ25844.1 hypothetical protein PCORN_16063 [Listeria cornellensis FSL F6-0969]